LRPRPGDCLHSVHSLLLHASDGAPGALQWAPGAGVAEGGVGLEGGLWRGVCCARCESRVGEAILEVAAGAGGESAATAPREREKTLRGAASPRPAVRSKRQTGEAAAASVLGEAWGVDNAGGDATPAPTACLPPSAAGALGAGAGGGPGADDASGVRVMLEDGSWVPWDALAERTEAWEHEGDGGGEGRGGSAWRVCGAEGPTRDVRLWKQWVASSRDPARDLFAAHSLLRRLASDLTEAAAAHTNFRAVLRASDRAARPPAALLSLLSASALAASCFDLIPDPFVKVPPGPCPRRADLPALPRGAGSRARGRARRVRLDWVRASRVRTSRRRAG
jgi:hypothetical protein